CLPPASGPVPATPHAQPFTADFSDANPAAMGFRIIGFAPNRPLRFRYSMTPSTEACPAPVGARIELVAEGNLDQDGQHSRFTRALVVDAHRELRALAPLRVERATE
ncbi:MAG: hypothetical protein KC417_03515, partial [Myxococcales bacterium]|nr:hypothetical protein [Myxococcales bacterium]